MPLDALGCTRATLAERTSCGAERPRKTQYPPCRGSTVVIIGREPGILSKRRSSACVDYVPAFCTHRPSLFPIEWSSEVPGLFSQEKRKGNKLGDLEEAKVVTRYL
jgi:hypothetical protein